MFVEFEFPVLFFACARLLCDALRPRVIEALRPLLESDAITKVIHDCREDTLEFIRRVKVTNSTWICLRHLFILHHGNHH